MKHMKLSMITLTLLLLVGSRTVAAQSEPEQFIGEGTIVAFQKYDRYPQKPHQRGMGNFVEEWIVRINRWESGTKPLGYFLVTYDQVSVHALSDDDMSQPKWRFTFRDPIFHEADYCAGSAPVPSKDGTFVQRPARMEDFQRTKPGISDPIPPLKDLPCLIANVPPTSLTAKQRESGAKDKGITEQLTGEGAIVAFQKYDRYHGELYKRGLTSTAEEWIVRIDAWENGDRAKGYVIVKYVNLVSGALSDSQINQPKWRFTLREPINSYEAEDCAGTVPVLSEDEKSYHERPAVIEDFQRTKPGVSDSVPPLKDLPCLIAEKLPVIVDTVATATPSH